MCYLQARTVWLRGVFVGLCVLFQMCESDAREQSATLVLRRVICV